MSRKQYALLAPTAAWMILGIPMIPVALVLRLCLLTWRAYLRAGLALERVYTR